MSKISRSFFAPLLVAVISFFTLYFFFPSLATKYLGFAYDKKTERSADTEQMKQKVEEATGASLDKLKDKLNLDSVQDLLGNDASEGSSK
ncbi:MAG: hypothetical protein LKE40_05870 [Spirochaetia bacterium]|jgi:hypothetical protein|nr:hypothetical protein [Spirochaetia bacterium]